MTQISKRFIKEEVHKKTLNIFLNSLLKIDDKKTANGFFKEFFTPTERVMLSKRIVCFYLLFKRVSIRNCSDILKTSTATVTKYKLLLEDSPTIKGILEKILKTENIKRLFDTILNEYISPPFKYGSDWKAGSRIYNEYKRRKKSPL